MVRERLSMPDRHKDFVINMDQVPVFFSMAPKHTLEKKGMNTITVRTSTSSTKRVTVATTVTASGRILTPFLVFKGQPNGRIIREFPTYPAGALYCCQNNAWMDVAVMHKWIDEVLRPYVQQAPPGIVPLLMLDQYKGHMVEEVAHHIQDLGVEVEYIPANCTFLAQPVDVGIGKPMKDRIRASWEAWMVASGALETRVADPRRQDVAQWVVDAVGNMTESIVRNAWLHDQYSYYTYGPELPNTT
jgi:DDE superfamily endonuclease